MLNILYGLMRKEVVNITVQGKVRIVIPFTFVLCANKRASVMKIILFFCEGIGFKLHKRDTLCLMAGIITLGFILCHYILK